MNNKYFFKYKISVKNQFYCLSFLLSLSFFLLMSFIYLYNKLGVIDRSAFNFVIVFYLLYLIPVIFLHSEYLILNYNTELYFDGAENSFLFIRNKLKLVFNVSEIENITIFEDKNGWFSTSQYSYFTIKIKNSNELLIITSFLIRKFKVPFVVNKNKIIHKRRIIPSPFLDKYF
jgi:hypothetical protein